MKKVDLVLGSAILLILLAVMIDGLIWSIV
jgi:hypothetical protein